MERTIVHMDLDTFFVSVERLKDPLLKGRPVLVGGTSDRGVVASCSYEARKFGIHSAMSMRKAKQLCPQAIVKRGDHEQYSHYSNVITDIISESVPVYEKTSIDEFYLDFTGMDRFFGCYKVATELREKIIRETGLPISFAMSGNKTVSKIGTGEAKPNGQREIPPGTEKNFLAPLPASKIPMVGEKTFQTLRELGLEKIKSIQDLPVEFMEKTLGQQGIIIWKKANGICNSPVEPYSERKSISTESTFEKDTVDTAYLKNVIVSMSEKLAFQLRDEEKLTACVTVKIRYSDFETHTIQAKIGYTALDHILIEKAKELFGKLYKKGAPIRLIGVRFSHLIQGTYQFDLFEDTVEQIQLYQAMDQLRRKFGNDAVQRAAGMDIKHHDFNPFGGGKHNLEKAANDFDKLKKK